MRRRRYVVYVIIGMQDALAIRTFCAYKIVMTDAEIIKRLGGIRPVARKLGHRNHTTVQGWLERNRIPEWRKPEVLKLLPEIGA